MRQLRMGQPRLRASVLSGPCALTANASSAQTSHETGTDSSTVVGVQAGHGAISIRYADPVLAPVAVPSLGAGMLAALAASVAALGAALARRQRRRSA